VRLDKHGPGTARATYHSRATAGRDVLTDVTAADRAVWRLSARGRIDMDPSAARVTLSQS
jgi:hypothetical protein